MAAPAQLQELQRRSRRLTLGVIGLTLAVLAAAILGATGRVRARIRQQIAGRDGEVLHAVTIMEYAHDVAAGLAGSIADPGNQLTIVLKSSELRGVLGIRLFNARGLFVEGFPPDLRETALDVGDLPTLERLRPACHFDPAVTLSRLFYGAETTGADAEDTPVPLLRVNVPLHTDDTGLAGIAQFLIDGTDIAAEYRRLDRYLGYQVAGAFLAGGGILSVAMHWAFRRLRRVQDLLAARTSDLAAANQELAMAARTSAVGAIASHLLHDLRNPMVGLDSFMANRADPETAPPDSDWGQAAASTRRMLALIDQVTGVLREEHTGTRYEVTLEELSALVADRVAPLATKAGVLYRFRLEAQAELSNHTANLACLVLVNLLHNAVQATPPGKSVSLVIGEADGALDFEVRDEGPGFPPGLTPFAPCHSTKPGGSGVGLAISKQLAQHLGASLALRSNTPQGCVFSLVLPVSPETAPLSEDFGELSRAASKGAEPNGSPPGPTGDTPRGPEA